MMLTEKGEKFGTLQVCQDLPIYERLMSCSVCEVDQPNMLQFRYCGTRGAICRRCLSNMQDLVWHQSRLPGMR